MKSLTVEKLLSRVHETLDPEEAKQVSRFYHSLVQTTTESRKGQMRSRGQVHLTAEAPKTKFNAKKHPEHYKQFNWDVKPGVNYLWKKP